MNLNNLINFQGDRVSSFANRSPVFQLPGSNSENLLTASALNSMVGIPPSFFLAAAQPKKFELPERFTKNGRKRATPFPLKLMKVLSDDQYSHIITWMPNGRSFVILRPRMLVSEILPKHFKSAQYSSFTRKLVRWGFTRCEEATGEFYHPQFRRGRIDLAEQMSCQVGDQSKSNDAKKDDEKRSPSPTATPPPSEQEQLAFRNVMMAKMMANKQKTAADIKKQQEALVIEMEKIRLEETIRVAAASRKALSDFQLQQRLHRGGDSSSLALAMMAAGLPNQGNMLGGNRLQQLNSQAPLVRRANIQGAKSA